MTPDQKRRSRESLAAFLAMRYGHPKEKVSQKQVNARKRNEDYRMAREIGVPVSEIL